MSQNTFPHIKIKNGNVILTVEDFLKLGKLAKQNKELNFLIDSILIDKEKEFKFQQSLLKKCNKEKIAYQLQFENIFWKYNNIQQKEIDFYKNKKQKKFSFFTSISFPIYTIKSYEFFNLNFDLISKKYLFGVKVGFENFQQNLGMNVMLKLGIKIF